MTFQEPSYQPNNMATPNPLAGLFGSPSIESYISSYLSYLLPCLVPVAIAEKSDTLEAAPSFPNEKKTGLLQIEEIERPAPAAKQGDDDVVQHPYSSQAMAMRHYQRGGLQDMTTEQLIKLQHEAVDGR